MAALEKGLKCILKDLACQSEFNGQLCKIIRPYQDGNTSENQAPNSGIHDQRYIVYVYKAKQYACIKRDNLKVAKLKHMHQDQKREPVPEPVQMSLHIVESQSHIIERILHNMLQHKKTNRAKIFANNLLKTNPENRFNRSLSQDIKYMLSGNCIYIPNFFSQRSDNLLFDYLMHDIKDCDMTHRFRRLMVSNEFDDDDNDDDDDNERSRKLITYKMIAIAMAEYFNVELKRSIINLYRDGGDYASFHTDKYDRDNVDITIGASFGHNRDLAFMHKESLQTFPIQQQNNDIFAFTSVINTKFRHSVLKTEKKTGPRFSIIVWGKRRSLNERNSSYWERSDREKALRVNPDYNVNFLYARKTKKINKQSNE